MDELTNILSIIATIKGSTEEVEFKYLDTMESFRTLGMYNLKVDEQENEAAQKLPQRWQEVMDVAKVVDGDLDAIKEKFTETTVDQVKTFRAEIRVFKQEFFERGPGSNELDMDKGLDALVKTKEILAKFSERREHLVRAEKLFNLPISSYSDLYDVDHQVKELESRCRWDGHTYC